MKQSVMQEDTETVIPAPAPSPRFIKLEQTDCILQVQQRIRY